MKKLAYKINAEKGRIERIQIENLEDMQACVGGLIELAGEIEGRNDLYVDEEGLCKEVTYGFRFKDRIFAGNGLIIGHNGKGASCDVNISELQVALNVDFISRLEID